jgi:hypothetical protein
LLKSNVQSDNGLFTALDVVKVKKGASFNFPVKDIIDFDFNGFVNTAIGKKGEIETATYNLLTNNLEDINVAYDKLQAGGTDILRLSFDEQVGESVINFDSRTITAVLSRDGDINDIEDWNITTSYGSTSTIWQTLDEYTYSVQVANEYNSEIWTLNITQEYDLSFLAYGSSLLVSISQSPLSDDFKVFSNSETSIVDASTNYYGYAPSKGEYYFNFLFGTPSYISFLTVRLNQPLL